MKMIKGLIDKYIAKHVLSSIGLVILMLSGIEFFMLFVRELGVIGHGNYKILSAFIYVFLQLPYQVYLFFPIACLLGVLLGMGTLANNSELLVMQASGVSQASIIWRVFKIIGALVLVISFLGEITLPNLIHTSEEMKTTLRSGGQAIRVANGLWLRQDDSFIHIENIISNKRLADIYQYDFIDNGQLKLARYIKFAQYKSGAWHIKNIKESYLPTSNNDKNIISTRNAKDGIWSVKLSPDLLQGEESNPNEMNLWQLGKLVMAQYKANIDSSMFELNFWRRLFQPLATFIMVMIALPFIFGSTRSISTSQRFMLGTILGFAFHILNKFTIPFSQIYPVQPFILALLPIVIFAMLGLVILRFRPMQG